MDWAGARIFAICSLGSVPLPVTALADALLNAPHTFSDRAARSAGSGSGVGGHEQQGDDKTKAAEQSGRGGTVHRDRERAVRGVARDRDRGAEGDFGGARAGVTEPVLARSLDFEGLIVPRATTAVSMAMPLPKTSMTSARGALRIRCRRGPAAGHRPAIGTPAPAENPPSAAVSGATSAPVDRTVVPEARHRFPTAEADDVLACWMRWTRLPWMWGAISRRGRVVSERGDTARRYSPTSVAAEAPGKGCDR